MSSSKFLTLDANVFVAALKADEPYSERCSEILSRVPGGFALVEPSIVYVEVLGALARRVGLGLADKAKAELERMVNPLLTIACNREFCLKAYALCHEYDVYAVDSLYLETALEAESTLVSLDGEDFVDRVRLRSPPIEVLHVSEF
ncbi:type II toxin-antitoxin system VapC family toxin [Candidatus Bathyarchaeota archaeon]|jgi:predicted nucleic acid-binding protein|nr:type II toxin-antitoxin system VapC family toxin [Candidatus Bathyarchaeota archaeon]